jgi:NAD(P)-dependent dehydrogenase (short-subunit alcohol dehydrogenase family)
MAGGAPTELGDADVEALLRWRLALGPEMERASSALGMGGLASGAGRLGLREEDLGEIDDALTFPYGDGDRRSGGGPYVPRWLDAIRRHFGQETVALMQKDAIERKGITKLLFEPETMPLLEKNVELVALLLSSQGMIPDAAKEAARAIVREVVEDLRRRLELAVRTAVYGALRRDRHSPMPLLRNLDWQRTIRTNLKGWDAERQRLIPERIHFWANQRRRHEWDVILVVDQSGSMARTCVYASVMAAIFASLDALRTRMVLYDTEVVDVSHLLDDPVEILFTAQLGGGNDGKRALAYVQDTYLENPEKTIFLWITDLGEPQQDFPEIVSRMRTLVDSKVKTFVLLALDEGGRPWFDHELAAKLTEIGVLCFGCTPRRLVDVMERAIKGQDVAPLVSAVDGRGRT